MSSTIAVFLWCVGMSCCVCVSVFCGFIYVLYASVCYVHDVLCVAVSVYLVLVTLATKRRRKGTVILVLVPCSNNFSTVILVLVLVPWF